MFLKDALDSFGNVVVIGSRKELKNKNKNASSKLSNSIGYDLTVNPNSFSLSFSMEDYGEFVDQGVEGIGGNRADFKVGGQTITGKAYVKKKVFGSPYKYKKGIKNKPSRKHFDNWTVRKGIAGRGKDGKFQTRIGITTAISHSVWHTGLETTHFFTTPFEKAFKDLPNDLVEAYALDVEDLLEFTLK